MERIFLDADWPSFSDFTDFCLFSLVTTVVQWLSYLVIACFHDLLLFSGIGSSLGPVHVGAHVHIFDLHRKVTHR